MVDYQHHVDVSQPDKGVPSLVWRAGQYRRFQMIRKAAGECLCGRVLDAGCGIGLYMRAFSDEQQSLPCHNQMLLPGWKQPKLIEGSRTYGIELAAAHIRQAKQNGQVAQSYGENLPFVSASFELILSHEVLEHVIDDAGCLSELARVLKPGGRLMLFLPNRWWFFETHGIFWRGVYHFGNYPFVNYLPARLRMRLAPHVRVYSASGVKQLLSNLPLRIISHHYIFPAFDNLIASRPRAGTLIRRIAHYLEATPFAFFGLSHFLVLEKKLYERSALS